MNNQWLALDRRSLALFRIFLAIFFLIDVIDRWMDIAAHYANSGIVPHAIAKYLETDGIMVPKISTVPTWAVHFLSTSPLWTSFVFILALLSGFCFLIGFTTKVANILCWIMGVSFVNASPLLIYPGDYILNILLLVGTFVPLNDYFALDAISKRDSRPVEFVGPQVWPVFLVNFLFMFTAGLVKIGEQWLDGTAIKTVMMTDQYSTSMRDYLLPHERFMTFMTYATIWMERVLPFLIFIPGWRGQIRMWGVISLILFLLSIRVFVSSQNLSFICAAGLLALLPACFWDFLAKLGWASAPADRNAPQSARSPKVTWLLGSVMGAFCLLLVILDWNRVAALGVQIPKIPIPPGAYRFITLVRVANNNVMFGKIVKTAPYGWVVARATLKDGQRLDLISGRPNDLSMEAMNDIAAQSLRWRRFFTNAFFKPSSDKQPIFRELYTQYICREWNRSHPDNPVEGSVEVVRMDYVIAPGDSKPSSAKEGFRAEYPCQREISLTDL